MADEEITDPAEAAQLLASAKMAIDEALENLEQANPDLEVSGYALRSYSFRASAFDMSLVKTMPSLKGGLTTADDGSCINILCGGEDLGSGIRP